MSQDILLGTWSRAAEASGTAGEETVMIERKCNSNTSRGSTRKIEF